MFCPKCGSQNSDTAGFCVSCGAPLNPASNPAGNTFRTPPPPPPAGGPGPGNDPGADTVMKIVSFCFPIVGIILYFVWKQEKPKSASDVCKFAAIGFGVGVVLYILMMALGLMAGAAGGY